MLTLPTPDDHPLALGELRAALGLRGIELSDSRLKRLRREGLLLVGEQRHRPGLRGSESVYPAWTLDQLELVERLARGERRFSQLRVLVRWHGGWVQPDKLRATLIALLDAISSKAREIIGETGDEDDRADRLAQAFAAVRGRSGRTRLMRRRLNNVADDFERTMYALAALSTDSPLEWANHDPEDLTEPLVNVVERALAIDRARTDEIGGNGPLLRGRESGEEILGELQQVGAFDILNLGAAFTEPSDQAISQAFADAKAFAGLSEVFDDIQAIAGEDVAGLGSITEVGAAHDAIELALLVRGLLLLRPLMAAGALEQVVEAAAYAAPQLRAAREICRGLPQYSAFIAPSGPAELAKLPAAERDRIVAEIHAYLQAHPELIVPAAPLRGNDSAQITGTRDMPTMTTGQPGASYA